jgi:hypothetical protein
MNGVIVARRAAAPAGFPRGSQAATASEVTFELSPHGNDTRIRVTQHGRFEKIYSERFAE